MPAPRQRLTHFTTSRPVAVLMVFLSAVVFGFFCFVALHYLLWGWWLKSIPPEEDEDE